VGESNGEGAEPREGRPIIGDALPLETEDLARTALIRILPRERFRLAALNDARFQSFAANCTRIAYRQQGATPSFLLFSGPGQNPVAAATAAAAWAAANWTPNAIQRRVSPGVVVVHVAPGNQLTPSGPVAGAAVPAAVWTVDSATGAVDAQGRPPGAPSGADVTRAVDSLLRGTPAPSLGELDLAERGVMQIRTASTPRWLTGIGGLILLYLALRYGLGGLSSLFALPYVVGSGGRGASLYLVSSVAISVLMLAGIVFGIALLFNFRNLALRVPGFSSPDSSRRNLTWGGYIAAMVALAVVLDGVMPSLERQAVANGGRPDYTSVKATVDDDGGETYVAIGGHLDVDLTGWPQSEWKSVTFKTSNPSVLSLDSAAADRPTAAFTANQQGVSRVDASSADGRYTFQLRVDSGPPP
jgi:hypothetical protein